MAATSLDSVLSAIRALKIDIQSRDYSSNKSEAKRQAKALNALSSAEVVLLDACTDVSGQPGYYQYVFEEQ